MRSDLVTQRVKSLNIALQGTAQKAENAMAEQKKKCEAQDKECQRLRELESDSQKRFEEEHLKVNETQQRLLLMEQRNISHIQKKEEDISTVAKLEKALEKMGEEKRKSDNAKRRAMEAEASTKKKLERQKQKYDRKKGREKGDKTGGGGKSDSGLSAEHLKEALRCPVCHNNFKDVVIARPGCFHMLCKTCLDKNLASRNRKCPSCNTSFSKNDVHPMSILSF
eukprot:g324.t1